MKLSEFKKAIKGMKTGDMVRLSMEGKIIKNAKIQLDEKYYNNTAYFICQNILSGASCNDKLGYKYSWAITDSHDASRIDFIKLVKVGAKSKKVAAKKSSQITLEQLNKAFDVPSVTKLTPAPRFKVLAEINGTTFSKNELAQKIKDSEVGRDNLNKFLKIAQAAIKKI